MSKLTDDCMAGMELRDHTLSDYVPMDFAISNDVASLIFLTGWWDVNNPSVDGALQFYASPLSAGVSSSDFWVNSDASLGPSDELQQAISDNRDRTDFERTAYLSALLRMVEDFPAFDFGPWMAAFQARPVRDAVVEAYKTLTASRQMAKLFMSDASGNTVDVLVIDDRGDAVTASGDPWLDRVAMDYVAHKPNLPPLADYVNGVLGQQPYGGNGLFGPAVFTSGGFLLDVANNLLSSRRVGV